jgi:hypothetical protein
MSEMWRAMLVSNFIEDSDFSLEHLQSLIVTMKDWTQPWSQSQMAAWRLRWFGVTPEDDERRREEHFENRRWGLDDVDDRRFEGESFNDWPNGQGTYD